MENINNKFTSKIKHEYSHKDYYKATIEKEISFLLKKAVNLVQEKDKALDLGAGALADSKYLLKEGFKKVEAVDMEDMSKYDFINLPDSERFEYFKSSFDSFDFKKNNYDFILANNALSFSINGTLKKNMENIFSSLKKDGIFVGNFFDKSSKNFLEGFSFIEKEELDSLLKDFEILFKEKEIGKTALKDKKNNIL